MPGKRAAISGAIRKKLQAARVARLATVATVATPAMLATLDAKGRPHPTPHVVPVCFALVGNLFYTAIDQKPKRVAPERLARVRNIEAAPEVALLVDRYDEDWRQLWYILIRGRARLVPKTARRERALAIRKLREKYAQYAGGMLADDAPIIRIAAERITTWGKI